MAETARRCEGNRRARYFCSYAGQCRRRTSASGITPQALGLNGLVEDGQSGVGASLADDRQVSVDDGCIERVMAQVNTDLANGDALFQKMRGIAVTQRVAGGSGVDAG